MKAYYYWFYTIYNIYNSLSRDSHFYVFANGLFTFIVFCTLFWVICGINLVINTSMILFENKVVMPALFIAMYVFNYFLFIRNNKHLTLFKSYIVKRTNRLDAFAIIFSVLMIIMALVVLLAVRKTY